MFIAQEYELVSSNKAASDIFRKGTLKDVMSDFLSHVFRHELYTKYTSLPGAIPAQSIQNHLDKASTSRVLLEQAVRASLSSQGHGAFSAQVVTERRGRYGIRGYVRVSTWAPAGSKDISLLASSSMEVVEEDIVQPLHLLENTKYSAVEAGKIQVHWIAGLNRVRSSLTGLSPEFLHANASSYPRALFLQEVITTSNAKPGPLPISKPYAMFDLLVSPDGNLVVLERYPRGNYLIGTPYGWHKVKNTSGNGIYRLLAQNDMRGLLSKTDLSLSGLRVPAKELSWDSMVLKAAIAHVVMQNLAGTPDLSR